MDHHRPFTLSLQRLPLAVDLDDTLILTDSFFLQLKTLTASRPWLVPVVLFYFLTGGRPAAKAWLARQVPLDPATLPYRQELIAYLHRQKAGGRKIFLVSAADQDIVTRVAEHLQLFDGAFGSDGKTNLKARAKADFITKKVAPDFVYAGDALADLAVWRKAAGAILCGKAVTFEPGLGVPVETCFPNPGF